jgi:hypothetical protein
MKSSQLRKGACVGHRATSIISVCAYRGKMRANPVNVGSALCPGCPKCGEKVGFGVDRQGAPRAANPLSEP